MAAIRPHQIAPENHSAAAPTPCLKLRLADERCSQITLEFTYNLGIRVEIRGSVLLIDIGGRANLGLTVRSTDRLLSMGLRRSTKSDRNRAIFLAFQAGSTTRQLAEASGLATVTVRLIICHERHKFEVSMEEIYQRHRLLSDSQTNSS